MRPDFMRPAPGCNAKRCKDVGKAIACYAHPTQYLSHMATAAGVRIGAVYLRAGYSPDDYPTDAHWGARGKLERSSAAKCPSVAFQLAGAKKVLSSAGLGFRVLCTAPSAACVQAALMDLLYCTAV